MTKLLSSGWFVVRKNKLILLICLVMFVAAAFSAFNNAAMLRNATYEENMESAGGSISIGMEEGSAPKSAETVPPLKDCAMSTTPGLGIVFAFIISMFLNDDFSSGGIRDRIIGGFSRTNIYFANFLTAFFACGIVTACSLLGDMTVLGVTTLEGLTLSEYFSVVGLEFLLTGVFCAIYTLVGMLVCGRGASSGVVCLILTCVIYIILLIAYAQIYSMLNEPEYYQDYGFDENGGLVPGPMLPNPSYLSGPERDMYMTIFEIMPVSQSTLLIGFAPPQPLLLAAFSAILIAACSIIGNVVFKHRDLN